MDRTRDHLSLMGHRIGYQIAKGYMLLSRMKQNH
jgi:hypothetical protein